MGMELIPRIHNESVVDCKTNAEMKGITGNETFANLEAERKEQLERDKFESLLDTVIDESDRKKAVISCSHTSFTKIDSPKVLHECLHCGSKRNDITVNCRNCNGVEAKAVNNAATGIITDSALWTDTTNDLLG